MTPLGLLTVTAVVFVVTFGAVVAASWAVAATVTAIASARRRRHRSRPLLN